MHHRDSIVNLIHEVVGVMDDSLEVVISNDNQGYEISETSNSVLVKLIALFTGVDGAREYSDINLNILAWGQVRITKISKHNLNVQMIVDEFIKLFSQAYQKALDADKTDKQANQAVKALSNTLVLKKLSGIKEANDFDDTKSKFQLIKSILA